MFCGGEMGGLVVAGERGCPRHQPSRGCQTLFQVSPECQDIPRGRGQGRIRVPIPPPSHQLCSPQSRDPAWVERSLRLSVHPRCHPWCHSHRSPTC